MHWWAAACLQAVLAATGAASVLLAAGAPDPEALTAEELVLVQQAEARRIAAIQSVMGAVVAIYGKDRRGGGSAVIYDGSGLALTNHHVVAAAGPEGWGGLADGRHYRWRLIGTDPGGDVAVIQLTGKKSFPAAPLGDSGRVRVGDWALAMGNPFRLAEDQKPTVTLGIVSGVQRYQPGAGLNTLVYGNCIQIDSSINPGNSGGPLFNLRGEIVGINGRGSFKERGRVNVGLGYAIPSNQIKNFLPDLLATKIAQHGTLDALFDDRDGKVVCQTINLDAPVAAAGLRLGDQLIALEGIKIGSANQLTSLLSTLPADWPAHLVYERDGRRSSIWVRLLPLPYRTQAPRPAQPMPKAKPSDEGQPGEPRPPSPSDKSGQKGAPRGTPPPKAKPKRVPPAPKIPIVNPGTIRDEKLNQQNCRRIIAQWRDDSGFGQIPAAVKALRITDQIMQGGRQVGTQQILLATDGRFRIDLAQGARSQALGFDGQHYWARSLDGEASVLPRSKALLNPHIAQVATLAALLSDRPLESFGKVWLDGADKSQRRPAYRIKTLDAQGDWFYVWLSVADEEGRLNVRLLKASPDIDGGGLSGAVTYSDWRLFQAVRWPCRRDFVRGLGEEVQRSFVTTSCQALPAVSRDGFPRDGHAGQED